MNCVTGHVFFLIQITSKVWGTWHSRVEEALDETLANLGTDYLDRECHTAQGYTQGGCARARVPGCLRPPRAALFFIQCTSFIGRSQ